MRTALPPKYVDSAKRLEFYQRVQDQAAALPGVENAAFGSVLYAVTQRSREIGLRMALDASAVDVTRMVIRQGIVLTGVGIATGLAASWAATRALKNLLYGVSATDPITFVSVAALLTLIALAACWIPARRASRVDPIVVLRDE
jgi:putative ABC transport system permease protein